MPQTEDSDSVVEQDIKDDDFSDDLSPRRFVLREEEAEVVRPTVERAILLSSQHDHKVLARALSSVVASALWHSITGFLKRAIVRVNRFFVLNISGEGIRWRLETFRTGKPFGQIVLEHSMIAPVSQVFLIHRRTGLLIEQVQQKSHLMHDGDMVSGMLTAIQDFVHDSFQARDAGRLEVIRIGDVTVLLEQGPLVIMAGIISQGFAPQNLRQTFRRAVEQISDDYHESLVNFKGDSGGFDGVTEVLESCLKTRLLVGEDRFSPLTGLTLLVPILLLVILGYFGWQQHMHWKHYIDSLSHRPGIVVLDTGWKGFHRTIRGLHDPLVTDPVGLLIDSGIDAESVVSDWKLYCSLDQNLVLERVRSILNPPATVSITLHNGLLSMSGTAPWHWVERAPSKISAVGGVTQVRTDGIRQTGANQQLAWNQYLAQIAELPGILVLKQGRGRDSFFISGMRDLLAPDPVEILVASGLDTNQVVSRWEPFQALHPSLIVARAKRMLEPPEDVELTLEGQTLQLKGSASHAWISAARIVARGIAGVSSLDLKELTDSDMEEFNSLASIFDEHVFYYLANHRDLWPGQEKELRQFVVDVNSFEKIVRRIGGGYHIDVRGHVLGSGNAELNQKASEAIADRFFNLLKSQQVDIKLFVKRGMGGIPSPMAAKSDTRKRESHVSFQTVADE